MEKVSSRLAGACRHLLRAILLTVLLGCSLALGAPADLLHNSQTTGSSKWSGKWGTAEVGAKYGEFTCTTCHDRNSTNIKRLRTSIRTPDGTNWAGPGTPSVAVTFLDARDGASHFGDDDPAHTTSNRICEVCHSQTSYHRYNQTLATHYNQSDCTACHKHNRGFKASCSACHGGGSTGSVSANFWPDGSGGVNDAGRHARHLEILANRVYSLSLANLLNDPDSAGKQRELCSYCHDTPGDDGDHGVGTDAEVNAFYALWSKTADDGLYSQATDSCSSIACHNNQDTTATYSWYGATGGTCTMCHTAGDGGSNPASGLHDVTPSVSGQRHDQSVNGGCVACHTGIGAQTTHYNGDFQGGSGQTTQMGLASFYTQTADNTGTCIGTGCHFPDGGLSDDWAHQWNSTATFYTDKTTACAGCHGDWANGWNANVTHRTSSGTQNTHGDLYTDYACGECHVIEATTGNYAFTFGTSDWASAGNATKHGNGTIEVNSKGSYNASNLCFACHKSVDGKHDFADTGWNVDAALVGDNITASCSTCHGGGTTGTGGEKNIWPDGSTAANRAGEHDEHMTALAARVYGLTLAGLVNDASSLDKQKALCEYCHAAVTNDDDHMTPGSAEVFVAPISTASTRFAKSLWNTADGNASYSAAADTCSNVDCHNSKLTAEGTFGWYDGGTSTCTLCHTPGGASNDPTSGLHKAGTLTSGTPHDDSFGTGGTCTTCHSVPAIAASSAHINGTFTANNTTATNEYYTLAGYTDGAVNAGTCSGGTVGSAGCHDSIFDAGTWARKWSTTAYNTDGTQCANCHGGLNETDWTFGSVANTSDFSVEHNRNWDGDGASGEVIGNHLNMTANTSKCNICHVYGDAPYSMTWGTGNHGNNKITLNSTMGYSGTGFNCATTCHSDNNAHSLEQSANTNWTTRGETLAGPTLSCTSCHTGSGSGALKVGSTSSHVIRGTKAGYNTFNSCENCHPYHTGGVLVPNNATVGINYTAGGRTGFRLGGNATTGTTEAEICWNCHSNLTYQTAAISEWGTNNKQAGAPAALNPYDYGTVSTPNWTSATWTSAQANFAYKSGAIRSTHSVNDSATGAGMDAVAQIRCSYCHDVHDTASGVVTGDVAGKPFLRGTWWTNPYREDGAPRAGMTWTANGNFGAVPRGGTQATQLGGFQIDQNNGYPTNNGTTPTWNSTTQTWTWSNLWTNSQSAGLCTLCHGTNVDTMNKFGNAADAWVGTNGHSNAAIGGTGLNAVNIFRSQERNNSTSLNLAYTGSGTYAGYPVMAYKNADGVWGNTDKRRGYGFRGGDSDAFRRLPYAGSQGYSFQAYNWGARIEVNLSSDNFLDKKYHQFSCSKCHNPHASRLPRLMITNCLDTKQNTWDDPTASVQTTPAAGTYPGGTSSLTYARVSTYNGSVQWSNSSSAQNCHRVKDPQFTNSFGAGWNKVTPWNKTTGNPDNGTIQ